MPIWLVILLGLVVMTLCIIAGYIYGASHQKVSEDKIVGQLLVDPLYHEAYASFVEDPLAFVDGEWIRMQVKFAEPVSQQNQSS